MTRDDIIKLAREAGWAEMGADLWGALFDGAMSMRSLERFAALVADAEREACAAWAELVAREIDDTNGTATYIAKGIRARGKE